MRLSDLIREGGQSLDPKEEKAVPPERADAAPVPPVPPVDKPGTQPEEELRVPPVQRDVPGAVYDSAPKAIYEAARQLEIPIPHNAQLTVREARKALSDVFAKALDPAAKMDGLSATVRNIAGDFSVILALDSNFARMIQHHTSAEDRIISHSINSAVIAINLARDIDKAEYSPHDIGTAALLHDIGVAALGLDLDKAEKPKFAEHVAKGIEILDQMQVPEAVRAVVAQHHERIDGSGYPDALEGGQVLVSSQILALAESFERIMFHSLSDKEEGEGAENYVQTALAESRKKLDPDILRAFIGLRGFYPDGTMVELTNRSVCLVIGQNEGFPLRPVVQVVVDGAGNHPDEARVIDLRTTKTLSVMGTVSQNGGPA